LATRAADHSAAPADVLDNDRLTEQLTHARPKDAAEDVGSRTRTIWHDDGDRPRRPFLRERGMSQHAENGRDNE
jgi:hypothetical protein